MKISKFSNKFNNSFWIALIPILWMLLFFIIPIFLTLKISFSEATFSIPPISSISNWIGHYLLEIKINLSNYVRIIEDSYYISSFVHSIILTTITTIICFLLGFSMAYGICQCSDRFKNLLKLLLSLSFWTSTLIRVYAWINVLSNQGLINNLLIKLGIINSPIQILGNYYTVCSGLVFCYLPYMIYPIYSILDKFDKRAYDLGCSPTKTFWQITLPLCKEGILTGSILVFSTSIGEFVIPELLGGPDTLMFGRILWMEFYSNIDWPMTCALAIIMMIFIITPIFIIQKSIK